MTKIFSTKLIIRNYLGMVLMVHQQAAIELRTLPKRTAQRINHQNTLVGQINAHGTAAHASTAQNKHLFWRSLGETRLNLKEKRK
ncbi:MAG: hypothetical protein BWY75_03640 [bacterium ADurb.Bin425]|nr:MAG: hypothetical protein BWY75_03640 [bacterium ADurb.Bin425]